MSQGLAGQEAKTEPDQDVFTKNLGSKLPTQTLSFASPWRPLQARMAKQDRPLSARPILPAQWSTNWQLSRPIPSLKAHMPVSTREDLTLPHDATTTTKSIRDLTARFDELQVISEHSFIHLHFLTCRYSQAGKRPLDSDEAYFQISTGSNTEYDLPRAWISNVETHARKAEPSGPKNLTSFFISQKAREVDASIAELYLGVMFAFWRGRARACAFQVLDLILSRVITAPICGTVQEAGGSTVGYYKSPGTSQARLAAGAAPRFSFRVRPALAKTSSAFSLRTALVF